jgi:DNA invertase Pin-like site-specific DNA recombinase
MTHTAIYLRVSSKGQDTRSQKPDLERWAKNQDGPVAWYTDHASGSTMARPGWEKLWSGVVSGEVERVVCWRIDRLGRTAVGLAQLFEDLPRHGVELVCLRDGIFGLDTPTGQLIAGIMAQVAKFEREVRAERQTAGIAAAKAAGVKFGRPKGQGGHAGAKGRRVKVTPEQEVMVRRLKSEGAAVAAIARATGLSRPTVYSVLAAGAE